MALGLPHGISPTGFTQEDIYNFLKNTLDLLNEIRTDYTALRADVTAIRTQTIALVADMATRITNHNTLATKLNSDAGVTDTNYAAASAITAVDPAALTAAAISSAAVSLNS